MGKLEGNIALLGEAKRDFDSANNSMSDMIKQAELITTELRSSWDGAACDEFITRLETVTKSLKSTQKAVKELSIYCKTSADDLQKLDKFINSITNLFDEGSFWDNQIESGVDKYLEKNYNASDSKHGGGGRSF